MDPNTTVRINITIPKNIWSELKKEVPIRGKSNFVADAIEEKLRVKKRIKAFTDLASLPPTFTNIADGATHISTSRKNENKKRDRHITS